MSMALEPSLNAIEARTDPSQVFQDTPEMQTRTGFSRSLHAVLPTPWALYICQIFWPRVDAILGMPYKEEQEAVMTQELWKKGDSFDLEVNQGMRIAYVLAVRGDEILSIFEMPGGRVYLDLWNVPSDSHRSAPRRSLPKKWQSLVPARELLSTEELKILDLVAEKEPISEKAVVEDLAGSQFARENKKQGRRYRTALGQMLSLGHIEFTPIGRTLRVTERGKKILEEA